MKHSMYVSIEVAYINMEGLDIMSMEVNVFIH